MSRTIDQTKPSRGRSLRTIAAVVGIGAVAATAVGTGALSTLYTTLAGNTFRAEVPDAGTAPQGALLRIAGDPIDHTFDTSGHVDQVRGDWTLTNHGPDATTWDGAFDVGADVPATLAAALTVEYGVLDDQGQVIGWRDAGTLAEHRSIGDVLHGTQAVTIAGGESVPIAVRVVLPDPRDLEGAAGDELTLVADFTVSYLDPRLGS
ncbi:hypothetical protein [Cellulosimicrobium cellulans]|uniref:hypothetical protein n=1 Tax=Cellulosimicrobium cellulans TaxID=1710 RepID=UPI00130DEF76|nr:hypothetical protein [Cellulosimicrobium cellulans]